MSTWALVHYVAMYAEGSPHSQGVLRWRVDSVSLLFNPLLFFLELHVLPSPLAAQYSVMNWINNICHQANQGNVAY